jgi:hypothetical protein
MLNNRRDIFIATLPSLSTMILPSGAQSGPTYKIGVTQRKFIPSEPYSWRGAATHALVATVWYPAEEN